MKKLLSLILLVSLGAGNLINAGAVDIDNLKKQAEEVIEKSGIDVGQAIEAGSKVAVDAHGLLKQINSTEDLKNAIDNLKNLAPQAINDQVVALFSQYLPLASNAVTNAVNFLQQWEQKLQDLFKAAPELGISLLVDQVVPDGFSDVKSFIKNNEDAIVSLAKDIDVNIGQLLDQLEDQLQDFTTKFKAAQSVEEKKEVITSAIESLSQEVLPEVKAFVDNNEQLVSAAINQLKDINLENLFQQLESLFNQIKQVKI